MSTALYGIGIIALIVIGVYVAYETDFAEDNSLRKDAESLIFQFNDYGEQIEIFKDPNPPQTQYKYEEKVITAVDEEGNIITNCNEDLTECDETETIVGNLTKVSEVIVEVQDRQTEKFKVCKLGHQCDIAGKITLINPVTKAPLDPPYGFTYVIRCLEADHPVMTCNNFEDRTETIISYPDSSFLISFTTNQSNNPPGVYEVEIKVNSHFTEVTEEGKEVPISRTAIREILMVA